MKTRFTIAVSMLAGAAIGGAAIQALHAQAKPPVYMIAINQVSDQEGYAKEYVPPEQAHRGVLAQADVAASLGSPQPELGDRVISPR